MGNFGSFILGPFWVIFVPLWVIFGPFRGIFGKKLRKVQFFCGPVGVAGLAFRMYVMMNDDDDGALDFNFMTILVRLDDTRMIRTQMIENVWKEYKCFFFVYIWN